MPRPLSFIIPAFNAESTIAETMRSILAQSHADLELIVVDDGSTDGTFAHAAAIKDSRISLIRRENKGVAAARNLGLRLAAGDTICFVDADDALLPDFAESMLGSLQGFEVAHCGLEYCDAELNPSGWTHTPAESDWLKENLSRFNQFAIGGMVFRASLVKELDKKHDGAFPEGQAAEDWEFLLRIVDAGARIARPVDKPFYLYRIQPETRSAKHEALWKAGNELIGRWAPPETKEQAQRQWALRTLGCAAASGRLAFTRAVHSGVAPICDDDLPCISGALRWSLRRERLAGFPTGPSGDSLDAALSLLTFAGVSDDHLTALRNTCVITDWGSLALSVARRLERGHKLVLFGYGRNGREAANALARAGIPFSVIDEKIQTPGTLKRLGIADLDPNHVVLVTPENRAAILPRLAPTRARVLTADSIAASIGSRAA